MRKLVLALLLLTLISACRKDLERVGDLNRQFKKLKGEWRMDSLYSYSSWFMHYGTMGNRKEVFSNGIKTEIFYESEYCGPDSACVTRDTNFNSINISLEFQRFSEFSKSIHYRYKLNQNNPYQNIDEIHTQNWSEIDRDTSIYKIFVKGENYTIKTLNADFLELEYRNSSSGLGGTSSHYYYLRFVRD